MGCERVDRNQVAKYAGVDKATVSCVLNNTRPTSEETRKRVMDAVRALNYVPDSAARAMKINKSYQLAMIVGNIAEPFFSELIAHFERIAMMHGYFVNICGGYGTFDEYINQLLARRIDGIFLAVNLKRVTREAVDLLTRHNVRICMGGWDRSYYGTDVSFINIDVAEGMRKHMLYLRELGHKSAAYMSCFTQNDALDRRASFYRSVHREVFGTDGFLFCHNDYVPPTIENGKIMASEMINEKKDMTAVICANDSMAVGAIKAIKELGMRCPDDMSVLGINNDVMSVMMDPEITTFGADYDKFADAILTELISPDRKTGNDLIVPAQHYIRGSTAAATDKK